MRSGVARDTVGATSELGRGTVGAVMVTFQPEHDLTDRLSRIADQVAWCWIVDNASSGVAKTFVDRTPCTGRVTLLTQERNLGLAAALNVGIAAVRERGLDWALLLDQDSEVEPGLVDALAVALRGAGPDPPIAVIGSNYPGSGVPAAAGGGRGFVDRPTVISSGSAVSLSAIAKIGGMREDLFIDYVDHEFCLRSRARGHRVILATDPRLGHQIGQVTDHAWGGHRVRSSHHAPVRRYYRARNQLLVYRSLGWREPSWMFRDAWIGMKAWVQMLLVEGERVTKVRAIVRGIRDGLCGRSGPAVPS